ncbi:MAG TPA: hypothetical protein VFF65_08035, partial [Phycisphaerales bacterium]|nr:hypothetical protein [Phycisphaerales bacterium]
MNRYREDLRALWLGLLLSMGTLLGGFGLGVVFGAFEQPLRAELTGLATESIAADPGAPSYSAESRVEKAWTFLRRSHLHANGMATTSLILIGLTPMLGAARRTQRVISSLLGMGSAGYAAFLVVAAFRTPVMGDPVIAKESLKWLAMPAAGVYIIAACLFTALLVRWALTGA